MFEFGIFIFFQIKKINQHLFCSTHKYAKKTFLQCYLIQSSKFLKVNQVPYFLTAVKNRVKFCSKQSIV